MEKRLSFCKMQSLGNDFIIIENMSGNIRLSTELIQKFADRHYGIGCDQLLMVCPKKNNHSDFSLRIFNQDASEVAQCGNGLRCIAHYLYYHGLSDQTINKIETSSGIYQVASVTKDTAKAELGVPEYLERLSTPILINGGELDISVFSVGNPHTVILTDDLTKIDAQTIGAKINALDRFPEGTNVEWVQIIDTQSIRVRVYERGVGETMACGSGATSAVAACVSKKLLQTPVRVFLPGGELLIDRETNQSYSLSGPVYDVFTGQINLA